MEIRLVLNPNLYTIANVKSIHYTDDQRVGPDIVLIQAYLNIYIYIYNVCMYMCSVWVLINRVNESGSGLTETCDSSSLPCCKISGHVKICFINGKIIPHVLSSRDNEALWNLAWLILMAAWANLTETVTWGDSHVFFPVCMPYGVFALWVCFRTAANAWS